jgi:hypothetical protein
MKGGMLHSLRRYMGEIIVKEAAARDDDSDSYVRGHVPKSEAEIDGRFISYSRWRILVDVGLGTVAPSHTHRQSSTGS